MSIASTYLTDLPERSVERPWLRRYSVALCFLVLGLILKGALVTSHDAGLAVPDWPTSYGDNMFLFPPSKWHGIIFYEHVHRLYASVIGLLTVILAVWVWCVEPRRWVRWLSLVAVGAVVLQGVLGGLTVLFLLPTAVSSAHAVLGQSFFLITVALAYSQSRELAARRAAEGAPTIYRWAVALTALVFLQLVVGAVMRHSEAGLAVLDFPTMGGSYSLAVGSEQLEAINELRLSAGRTPVTRFQAAIHVAHRAGAVVVLIGTLGLLLAARRASLRWGDALKRGIRSIGFLLLAQIVLGVATILTMRSPWLASIHVAAGAALLALAFLTVLRSLKPGALALPAKAQLDG